MIIKGITAQITRTITEEDTAEKVKSGSLPVLATPVLSAAMEEAAVKALAPFLSGHETTVGGSISLIHKAPTLPGHTITVTATVTEVRGKKISFHITASDENGDIGEADHDRFLVDSVKFMEKAEKRNERRE
ncbi:thioesterase family protein [uncultured Dialister sp.]|uniref:thioesterase family protein n=1 Tax=uncultured Dialister sp. TaxID=278064 RepID=UPI0025FD5CAB|nr:thioesterase family protein [uncultured Dialister sp.]